MTMNFSDERYVRLYVRDTAEWLALCWQARAVFPLVLKACDRAGVIQIPGGERRIRMLAGLIHLPVEVVTPGIADLLEDGCVAEVALGYMVPNFIEAQEAKASDKQRMRDMRERRRDFAAAGIDHHTSQNPKYSKKPPVTQRNNVFSGPGFEPKNDVPTSAQNPPDVTERNGQSRSATDGYADEQNVTPYRAVPLYKQQGARERLRPLTAAVRTPGSKPVVVVGGKRKRTPQAAKTTTTTNGHGDHYEGEPEQTVTVRNEDLASDLFLDVLDRLKAAGKSYVADTLNSGLWGRRIDGNVLELGALDEFAIAWFKEHAELLALEALRSAHPEMAVSLVVAQRPPPPPPPPWTLDTCIDALRAEGLTGGVTDKNMEHFWDQAHELPREVIIAAARDYRADGHWAPKWPLAKFIGKPGADGVWKSRVEHTRPIAETAARR